MILGLGCDIVQVSRFDKEEKFLLRFVQKYLTNKEIEELKTRKKIRNIETLKLSVATVFAAKEAVSKALGTGFQKGITLKDVEIVHNELGAPQVNLYNNALSRAYLLSSNQNFKIHITISNEKEYVNTIAILESV
ncbi:MAG: holo-ACP synthase [Alphaproteobacteria bacterium]|nr:holo-ACP synthase [Alphaproteobacteria bacterium]